MRLPEGNPQDPRTKVLNLTIAGILGQVGCVTLVIILAALLLGMWIDSRMGTRPTFALILLFGSIPVSLAAMFFITRYGISKMKPGTVRNSAQTDQEKEESAIGKDRDS